MTRLKYLVNLIALFHQTILQKLKWCISSQQGYISYFYPNYTPYSDLLNVVYTSYYNTGRGLRNILKHKAIFKLAKQHKTRWYKIIEILVR